MNRNVNSMFMFVLAMWTIVFCCQGFSHANCPIDQRLHSDRGNLERHTGTKREDHSGTGRLFKPQCEGATGKVERQLERTGSSVVHAPRKVCRREVHGRCVRVFLGSGQRTCEVCKAPGQVRDRCPDSSSKRPDLPTLVHPQKPKSVVGGHEDHPPAERESDRGILPENKPADGADASVKHSQVRPVDTAKASPCGNGRCPFVAPKMHRGGQGIRRFFRR